MAMDKVMEAFQFRPSNAHLAKAVIENYFFRSQHFRANSV